MKLRVITIALSVAVSGLHSLHAQEALYSNEFPAADVQLMNGPFQRARDLNIKTLLSYNTDRLLAGFRKEAGLPAKADSYPNWDGLDGHVAGHYLSALAINYAATGNTDCSDRIIYMISELKSCATANNSKGGWATGYLGAVPNSEKIWSGFANGNFIEFRSAWVPFYNIHKIFAGLRDAWVYAHNDDAKQLFLAFCDWAITITGKLSENQMQEVLNTEQGGMNEVLADAYQITGDPQYLMAARKFSHHLILDAMKQGIDNLDNKHANTQVPKAVGFERIGELSNDPEYIRAGNFFWQTVVTNRTLASGGNSRREFFPSPAASSDYINDVEGPETCNSYNMLKLTETAFRLNPLAKYADYYERTMYNHILSTQHPGHGGYVYFTPARPQHYRVYSSPNQAMWCCVGSGMENHSKYAQFIYTHRHDSLFINLFMPSTLDWKQKGISLLQKTEFPEQEQSAITITKGSGTFTLLIRYPGWVGAGRMKITINNKPVNYKSGPSSYIAIRRTWKQGDRIQITLPMTTRLEPLPGLPSYVAFMHGPILLAAKTGTDSLTGLIANDSRWGHIASGERLPIEKSPILLEDNLNSVASGLKPLPGKPLNYSLAGVTMINSRPLQLQPFYSLHDSRYMMYWLALNKNGYQAYLDSFASIERHQLELQKRTIDYVAPGEQQPEADHFLKQENSNTGNQQNQFWRSAAEGGFFTYELRSNKETDLSLLLRFWGAEWGTRKFDILVDNEKLLTVDNTDKWNRSDFQDVTYPIPASMLEGKQRITIRLQSFKGSTAGPVYSIRLIRNR